MPFDTEQKSYVYYGGTLCEFLSQATIFGKVYYDIKVKGVKKTVPASACSAKAPNTNNKGK